MGINNYTPDAANGAVIDGLGYIQEVDDSEKPKASNIRLSVEDLSDWIAFRTGGPTGDPDFKITGNGAPPVAGYTPTTRPILITGSFGLDASLSDARLLAGAEIELTPARASDRLHTGLKINTNSGASAYRGLNLDPDDIGEQPVQVETGQDLTGISVTIDASTGPALPGTRATLALYSLSPTGATLVDSIEDPANTLGAYRTLHDFTLTLASPITVGSAVTYLVVLVGESGVGAQSIAWISSSRQANKNRLNATD